MVISILNCEAIDIDKTDMIYGSTPLHGTLALSIFGFS